jgi:hypothetical protein
MNDSNVKKALISAASDFLTVVTEIDTESGTVGSLPIISAANVSWENRKFEPPVTELWSAVFYVPNNPVGRTVGVGGIDEANGFMQIDFSIPTDSGDEQMNDWEDKARVYFVAGRSFLYAGQNVLVISSGMTQGRVIDNNFRKSLTVFFTAQVKRPILTT